MLANWKSLFTTKPSVFTRGELEEMVFGENSVWGDAGSFAPSLPTLAVPDKGLPITTIYKGLDGGGVDVSYILDNPTQETLIEKEKLSIIELERAVAKIRFVFSRPSSLTDVEITKVEVDGNLIPVQTYVFPALSSGIALPPPVTYVSQTTLLQGRSGAPLLENAAIGDIPDPRRLTSSWYFENCHTLGNPNRYTDTPQGYDYWLSDAIQHVESGAYHPQATERLLYLRETDKPITGKIYYKVAGLEKTKVFTMEPDFIADPVYTNFYRNHLWTVFGYFNDKLSEIGLDVEVLPWYKRDIYIDYKTGSVNVVRRFTVPDDPTKYEKTELPDGDGYQISFSPGTTVTGDIMIDTPVGGKLYVTPTGDTEYFQISVFTDPDSITPGNLSATIDPRVNNGLISVRVEARPEVLSQSGLAGKKIDLSFSVTINEDTVEERTINIESESIDHYRFILSE